MPFTKTPHQDQEQGQEQLPAPLALTIRRDLRIDKKPAAEVVGKLAKTGFAVDSGAGKGGAVKKGTTGDVDGPVDDEKVKAAGKATKKIAGKKGGQEPFLTRGTNSSTSAADKTIIKSTTKTAKLNTIRATTKSNSRPLVGSKKGQTGPHEISSPIESDMDEDDEEREWEHAFDDDEDEDEDNDNDKYSIVENESEVSSAEDSAGSETSDEDSNDENENKTMYVSPSTRARAQATTTRASGRVARKIAAPNSTVVALATSSVSAKATTSKKTASKPIALKAEGRRDAISDAVSLGKDKSKGKDTPPASQSSTGRAIPTKLALKEFNPDAKPFPIRTRMQLRALLAQETEAMEVAKRDAMTGVKKGTAKKKGLVGRKIEAV